MRISGQRPYSISPKMVLSLKTYGKPIAGNYFEEFIDKKKTDSTFEAGETITQFNTFTVIDGLAYNSTSLESDNKYPEFFALNAVVAGGAVYGRNYGKLALNTAILEKGLLYQRVGTVNWNQTPLFRKSTTEDLVVVLGRAIDELNLFINIEDISRSY